MTNTSSNSKRRSAWATRNANDRLISILVGVAVVGSLLGVGAVHLAVLVPLSAVAIVSGALALGTRQKHTALAAPAVVVFVLAAYTLFQAVPLPMRLLGWLAPQNADVWRRALLPFGEHNPTWASVSLDPGASVVEALKWFTYGCIFTASAAVASRRGPAWGPALVFAAGLAAALCTVIHGLAAATKVYGIYQPRFAVAAWHVGPLLNPNNLAGYLNLAAMCGLGLMLARKPLIPRWVIGLGVATVLGVDISCASRGGMMVLPFGVLTFAAVALIRRRRGRDVPSPLTGAAPWLALLAVGGGTALALLGGRSETWNELYDRNLAKLMMFEWAKPMVREHLWLGIGRGAFESVFAAYRTEPGNTVYAHAESFPAEWAGEWGVPVALASLVLFAWLFRPSRLDVRRSAAAAGAWVGVAMLTLHNLADLGLEVPGVTFSVAAVLGSLWGGARRNRPSPPDDQPRHGSRGTPTFTLVTGMALLALAARFGWHDVARDRYALYSEYSTGDQSAAHRAAMRRELHAAMERHPAEPYFPLIGALLAHQGKDADPIPWLQRALERSMGNGRTHLLLADVLAGRGHTSQALMELRLAVEREQELAFVAARRAQTWCRDDQQIMSAVPDGRAGAGTLEALAAIQPGDAHETRQLLLERALKRDPDRLSVHVALGDELARELLLGNRSLACANSKRDECIAALESHAAFLETRAPDHSDGPRLRALLLRINGGAKQAEQLLARRCESVLDRPACLFARVQAAEEAVPPTELPSAIKDYLAARCGNADECADAAVVVGDLEAARGDWGAALAHYSRATRDSPTEQRWLKVADAAAAIGAHVRAADALESIARIRGKTDPALRDRIAAERAAALGDE